MKLALFDDFEFGVVQGPVIVPFPGAIDLGSGSAQDRLVALIEDFDTYRTALESASDGAAGIPLDSVVLRPPVPAPTQLLCAVKNYADDRQAVAADFFLKSSLSIIGAGGTIMLPPVSASVFHPEPELAVVIGRTGHNVDKRDALEHVFGYTGFIDASARDIGTTFYLRKSYATFGPMGPVLVTKDEFGDPYAKNVKLAINGQVQQNFSTKSMANRIDSLVELASSVGGITVGDVIATGTHHIGLTAIQDGDSVALEIEGIGSLHVSVSDPMKRTWPAPASRSGT